MMKLPMEKYDEEFNNFMHKVNEVSRIVRNLASKDPKTQAIGDLEAKQYLGEEKEWDKIDNEDIELKIKSEKTLINKKALRQTEDLTQPTMSQEAFMKEVERDANQRHHERIIRKERMETFKKQALLAYKRGEYEKALSCFNKAIEQIRDSICLYLNRALTQIQLKMYEKALPDLDLALRINEDCLKAWLLKAKVHYLLGDKHEYRNAVDEVFQRRPQDKDFIKDYLRKIEEENVL